MACFECQSGLVLQSETGEEVCGQCGLVLGESEVSLGEESVSFTPEEESERSRCGPAPKLVRVDKGLTTTMNAHDNKTRVLRRRQNTLFSANERNLSKAFDVLELLSGKLHIPKSFEEEAASLYRKAVKAGITDGRSIVLIATSCFYITCRINNIPRSISEFCEIIGKTEHEVGRDTRIITSTFDIRLPLVNPKILVSRFANRLNLSQKTQNLALSFLSNGRTKGLLVGKEAKSFASASLYMASKQLREYRTQNNFAKVCNVTHITLRRRCRELEKCLG